MHSPELGWCTEKYPTASALSLLSSTPGQRSIRHDETVRLPLSSSPSRPSPSPASSLPSPAHPLPWLGRTRLRGRNEGIYRMTLQMETSVYKRVYYNSTMVTEVGRTCFSIGDILSHSFHCRPPLLLFSVDHRPLTHHPPLSSSLLAPPPLPLQVLVRTPNGRHGR